MSKPLDEQVQAAPGCIARLRAEVARSIVGEWLLVDRLLVGLPARGHVLPEDVPGLAKIWSVRTLSAAIQASFHRIQFTPKLPPADIVSTFIENPQESKYHAAKGPVFDNFVLADETKRAPARVQIVMLETMQDRQVSLGGQKSFWDLFLVQSRVAGRWLPLVRNCLLLPPPTSVRSVGEFHKSLAAAAR